MELATQPDLFRAAGSTTESPAFWSFPLGNLTQSATYYLRAHGLLPEYLPILRGARRVLLAQRNFPRALPLFNAEIRLTSDPRRKAALMYAKGSLLADTVRNESEARAAYAAARELDPGNVSILKALEQIDTRLGAWEPLEKELAHIASSVEKNRSYAPRLLRGEPTCSSCATRTCRWRSSCSNSARPRPSGARRLRGAQAPPPRAGPLA